MAVLVYMFVLSMTALSGDNITPAGPVHSVFTVTGTSTAGVSSTVQVRVIVDPTGRTGLGELLVIMTCLG